MNCGMAVAGGTLELCWIPWWATVRLNDYAALIADYRAAGSSLRHIVVDFVGDCVVDNTTPTGYAGTNFTIFPVWEQAERISGGYASFYNYGWRFA